MKPSASPDQSGARCARCGSAFDCGRQTEPFDCWCRSMPPLPADRRERAAGCLCPGCLAAELAQAGQPDGSKPDGAA